MKTKTILSSLIVILVLSLALPVNVLAAPSNDNFADAQSIGDGLTDDDGADIRRLEIPALAHVAREAIRTRLGAWVDADDLDGDDVRAHGDQRLCPRPYGDCRHA